MDGKYCIIFDYPGELFHNVKMEIPVPNGRNAEEYIDELLEKLFCDKYKYLEWHFC